MNDIFKVCLQGLYKINVYDITPQLNFVTIGEIISTRTAVNQQNTYIHLVCMCVCVCVRVCVCACAKVQDKKFEKCKDM